MALKRAAPGEVVGLRPLGPRLSDARTHAIVRTSSFEAVRLVVPGCYGMASVKWLSSIEVIKGESGSYWETTDYAYWDRSAGHPRRRPLLGLQVKSLIARPSANGQVTRGTTAEIVGMAWSDGTVTRVEVSTDGGTTWRSTEECRTVTGASVPSDRASPAAPSSRPSSRVPLSRRHISPPPLPIFPGL